MNSSLWGRSGITRVTLQSRRVFSTSGRKKVDRSTYLPYPYNLSIEKMFCHSPQLQIYKTAISAEDPILKGKVFSLPAPWWASGLPTTTWPEMNRRQNFQKRWGNDGWYGIYAENGGTARRSFSAILKKLKGAPKGVLITTPYQSEG